MRYPVDNFETNFNITAGNAFGAKVYYGYHSGNDINGNSGGNTDCGTPLRAITNGIISSVIYQAWGYGKHLHLRFGINEKPYWAHYCHCQDIYVYAGQAVKEGDLKARMGATGNSNYCHLHFEIKNQPTGVDGIARTLEDLKKWENPIPFIKTYLQAPLVPLNDTQKVNKVREILNNPYIGDGQKLTEVRKIIG